MKGLAFAKLLVVGFLVATAATLLTTKSTYAQAAPDPNIIALEIVPVCSDETSHTAFWKVTNKNAVSVKIDWNNMQNNQQGSFDAPAGQSQLKTYFEATDPNNTTQFTWAGNITQTNATQERCETEEPTEPTPTPCINGSIQQNLVISWNNKQQVTVKTANNQPLCEDVTIFFSSYVMPKHYDGGSFYGNPTATPQTIFDSASATLKKGTNGETTLTIDLPSKCDNTQVDVYYGPEITNVGPNGHGTQNIESKVYMKELCGGMGGNNPTPTEPTPSAPQPSTPAEPTPEPTPTPVVEKTPEVMPESLPVTGVEENRLALWMVFGVMLVTYLGVYFGQKRFEN